MNWADEAMSCFSGGDRDSFARERLWPLGFLRVATKR